MRSGVEEMLAEQASGEHEHPELRQELDAIRDELQRETRSYVKKRVGKAEKRLDKRISKLSSQTSQLQQRIDQVEQDRKYAEWRLHANTEQMLDGLLREVRSIADSLERGSRRP